MPADTPEPDPLRRLHATHSPSAMRVVLAIALSFGVLLRWVALDRDSLWFDEGFSFWLASLEPREMLRQFSRDVQAPGYFLLLHYWTKLFGDSAHAMRALSATLSCACIAVVWLIARRLLDGLAARRLAVSLFAVAPLQILHAREARYYPLLTLLVLLSWLALLEWKNIRRRRWPAVMALSAAGSLYVHNMMLLYLPALAGAWLLLDRDRPLRQRLLHITLTLTAVVVLWLPWAPTFLDQLHWTRGRFWADRPTGWSLLETLSTVIGFDVFLLNTGGWNVANRLGLKPPLTSAESWMLLATALLVASSAIALLRRDTRRAAAVLLTLLLLPVMLSFARSLLFQPVFLTRTFIPGTAVACLLLALPTTGAGRWPRYVAAGVAGIVLSLALLSSAAQVATVRQEDWRGAYALLRELPRDGTLLVFVANEAEAVWRYYESREPLARRFRRIGLPSGYFDTDPPEPVRRVLHDDDLALLRETLDRGDVGRVVLLYGHEYFSDPQRLTERFLDQNLLAIRRTRLHGVSVNEYAVP